MKNSFFFIIVLMALVSCHQVTPAKDTSTPKKISHVPVISGQQMKIFIDSLKPYEGRIFSSKKLSFSKFGNTVIFATNVFTVFKLDKSEGYKYILIGNQYDLLFGHYFDDTTDNVEIMKGPKDWKSRQYRY